MEALNNMVNRKRTQASNLKKTRNRQRITNVLMTSLILGGTIIPVTTALADTLATEEQPAVELVTEETTDTSIPLADDSAESTEPTQDSQEMQEENQDSDSSIQETQEDTEDTTAESQVMESSDTSKDVANKELATSQSDSEEISFTVHYVDENGNELIPSYTYTGYEGQETYIEPPYKIDYSEHTQETYVLNKTQAITGFDGRGVSIAYSKDVTDMTFQYSPRTYHIGSDGFWYADDLEEHTGSNYFVDLDFTFTDKETGEVLATIKEDKYYYNIESGFSVDLSAIGIDTTKYGISLASQTHITHVGNPIIVNGQQTEYYSLFGLGRGISSGEDQFYNDGAGKMTLTIPLDRVSDTPTPPTTIDEENRPVLEQTITDAKPYLNKDKYQAKYVDVLAQAIKAGEQALADNPQVQSRSLFASTSTGTVFQPHIEAINTALADVKAHPVVPQDSTDDSTNTTDTNTSDSSSTNTTDTTSTSSTNEGTDTSKETIKPVSTKQNTDTSTNKKDTLPQTGESVNPWVTIAGLVALASTTFAWFIKRKKA